MTPRRTPPPRKRRKTRGPGVIAAFIRAAPWLEHVADDYDVFATCVSALLQRDWAVDDGAERHARSRTLLEWGDDRLRAVCERRDRRRGAYRAALSAIGLFERARTVARVAEGLPPHVACGIAASAVDEATTARRPTEPRRSPRQRRVGRGQAP